MRYHKYSDTIPKCYFCALWFAGMKKQLKRGYVSCNSVAKVSLALPFSERSDLLLDINWCVQQLLAECLLLLHARLQSGNSACVSGASALCHAHITRQEFTPPQRLPDNPDVNLLRPRAQRWCNSWPAFPFFNLCKICFQKVRPPQGMDVGKWGCRKSGGSG